jgi:hypothetical protein
MQSSAVNTGSRPGAHSVPLSANAVTFFQVCPVNSDDPREGKWLGLVFLGSAHDWGGGPAESPGLGQGSSEFTWTPGHLPPPIS